MPAKPAEVYKTSGWLTPVLAVLLLTVLPFLALSVYCHPSADDYWLTNLVIEKGFGPALVEIRQNWSGRYASLLLGALNPLVFRSITAYKIVPLLTFLLFLGSTFYLFSQGFPKTNKRTRWVLTLAFFALYAGFMPVVSQVFYWFSGTVSYQWAHIAMFLLLGLLLRLSRSPAHRSLNYLLCLLLVIFIAGSNETIMALQIYILCGLLATYFYTSKQLNKPVLGLLLGAIVGSILVILAPGNAIRSAEYPNQGQAGFALVYAVAIAINNSLNWLTHTPILLLTILFIPFCYRATTGTASWRNIHPAISWLLFYGIIAVGFFVSYYSKGDHAPPRVQDTIYLLFILGWFFNIYATVKYAAAKGVRLPALPLYGRGILILACFLWFFQNKNSNIRIAYSDLFSGQASRYNQEMYARYALLQNSNCQICVIPAVKNIPTTIFFEEIPADTTWKNRYFSQYFGKKRMILQKK